MTTTVADILEQRRLPEHDEIAAMLSKYFVGPITDDVVTKLRAEVERVLADPALHAGMARGFHPGNGGRGFGCAWREELAFRRTDPRSIDLAAWIAWSQPGYPPARPFCPDAYAGTWIQREPMTSPPARWVLERDGRFSAPATSFATRTSWCVHRQGTAIDDASVWLADNARVGFKRLVVLGLSPSELTLEPATPPTIRLERA